MLQKNPRNAAGSQNNVHSDTYDIKYTLDMWCKANPKVFIQRQGGDLNANFQVKLFASVVQW